MSSFSVVEKARPPGNVVVPAHAFYDNWEGRPTVDVCMGLRHVAEDDLQTARSQAAKIAKRLHPRVTENSPEVQLWLDAYHDALIRWIVARGTCDPNDVSRSWEGWRAAPEDIVAVALRSEGVRMIFDAWERMKLANDPTTMELSDEELPELLQRAAQRLPTMDRVRAGRVRRLLRFCLDELG